MKAQRVLRLLEFAATGDDEAVEEAIALAIAPGPEVAAGLLWTIVGRRPSGDGRSYVLATLWQTAESMLAAIRDGDVAVYRPAFAPYLAGAAVSVLDVDSDVRWCAADPPSIIRLFRVTDMAFAGDRAGNDPASVNVPPRGDPDSGPCLVLSAGNGDDRILLAVWPRGGLAAADRPHPPEASEMIASVNAMSRVGLGVEYECGSTGQPPPESLARGADSGSASTPGACWR